jgi:hypothetical protein
MSIQPSEKTSVKTPLYRKVLWVSLPVLILITILLVSRGMWPLDLIFGMATLLSLVILMLTSTKYYNWTLPFLGIFFIGLVFKAMRFPGAGTMISLSAMMVFSNLLFFSIKSFFVLRHNMFLKWFSFFTGIALALFMYIFMSKIQFWPLFMPFWILKHSINFMLIIIALLLVFKLPSLNFSAWGSLDRKVFYRLILLPLVIIFSFSITIYIYPNFFDAFFNRDWANNPWGVRAVELFDLEGIILRFGK